MLLQAFAAIMSRPCQGKIGDRGDFYLCQKLAMLLWMSLYFWCLDLLASARRLCSLSGFPLSSDAEDFLVSFKPSRDLIFNCMSPEPQGKPVAQSGSTWHPSFWGAENKQVYSYRSEAFLTAVEEERCPKHKFYKVSHM